MCEEKQVEVLEPFDHERQYPRSLTLQSPFHVTDMNKQCNVIPSSSAFNLVLFRQLDTLIKRAP